MQQIHNSKMRMPLILTEDQALEWLFGDLNEEDIKRIVSAPIASELMTAYTIAKDFRAMPDPATPFEYPELTPVEM